MLKARLMTWAGPLSILIGLMWLVIPINDFLLQAELIHEGLWIMLFLFSFVLSFVPMVFMLIATQLRFQHAVSPLGRFGLMLSVFGCVGVIGFVLISLLFGVVAPEIEPQMHLWVSYATLLSLLSIRVGYILFGIDVVKYSVLPRWNFLPLLLGLTFVLSLPMEWFGVPALLPSDWANPVLHFVVTSICWILLGIAMMARGQETKPVAAT